MAGFETARAEAMKTCGPELQGDGYAMDTNAAFGNAKKNLENKMGFIDKQLGGVDKQFDKVTNALRSRGQSACGDVLHAVSDAYKGELSMNKPSAAQSEKIAAKGGEAQKTTASLGNTYNILKNRWAAIDAASGT